jgi:tRNA(fMet)-specific endonuclease VapC
MAYLIDTDILIFSLKGHPGVTGQFKRTENIPKSISVVTYGELVYGARKSQQLEKNMATVNRIRELLPIINIDKAIMETFGEIKASLSGNGIVIDDMDLMIGATALTENLILVTHNLKHFSKIPGLAVEDWFDLPQ